eukprot:72672_1
MSARNVLYQKNDLKQKAKWTMDQLRNQCAEWECTPKEGGRWPLINAIFDHANNTLSEQNSVSTSPSNHNKKSDERKDEISTSPPNHNKKLGLKALNNELGVDIITDDNEQWLKEKEYSTSAIKGLILRTKGDFAQVE